MNLKCITFLFVTLTPFAVSASPGTDNLSQERGAAPSSAVDKKSKQVQKGKEKLNEKEDILLKMLVKPKECLSWPEC
jgi:hypothetical protein